MSTGKRLAKRSIIGTRVCAPGEDGKYYSGVIHAVKTPASAASESGLSITPKTRYSVRFDSVPGGRPPSPSTEYSDRDLIGPGFGSVTSARLVSGQKVYLTYNGREIHAEVTQHREHLDEVDVVIAPNGQEVSFSFASNVSDFYIGVFYFLRFASGGCRFSVGSVRLRSRTLDVQLDKKYRALYSGCRVLLVK